jgi:hypothetical protein
MDAINYSLYLVTGRDLLPQGKVRHATMLRQYSESEVFTEIITGLLSVIGRSACSVLLTVPILKPRTVSPGRCQHCSDPREENRYRGGEKSGLRH